MNFLFYFYFILIALLLLLLGWALRAPRKPGAGRLTTGNLQTTDRRHAIYLPQIEQALAPSDISFLASKKPGKLAIRVQKERRRVALSYLSGLREDFDNLLDLARVITVLSPQVTALQEFERLRLTMIFALRFQMIRASLLLGLTPLPRLSGLSNLVSHLAIRVEGAMRDLGERAAIASEIASGLPGGDLA